MEYIPERVFEEFLTELGMYSAQLGYVLDKLAQIQQQIQDEYERIEGDYNPEYHDAGDVWYQAAKNILGVDTMFSPHFQKAGAMGGYCIIVYHLFERFLEEVCRLRDIPFIGEFHLPKFFEAVPTLKVHPSFSSIEELKDLVNFCKHGRGDAETALRKNRPDYFTFTPNPPWEHETLKPLSGYDLEIDPKDFEGYVSEIKKMVTEIRKLFG